MWMSIHLFLIFWAFLPHTHCAEDLPARILKMLNNETTRKKLIQQLFLSPPSDEMGEAKVQKEKNLRQAVYRGLITRGNVELAKKLLMTFRQNHQGNGSVAELNTKGGTKESDGLNQSKDKMMGGKLAKNNSHQRGLSKVSVVAGKGNQETTKKNNQSKEFPLDIHKNKTSSVLKKESGQGSSVNASSSVHRGRKQFFRKRYQHISESKQKANTSDSDHELSNKNKNKTLLSQTPPTSTSESSTQEESTSTQASTKESTQETSSQRITTSESPKSQDPTTTDSNIFVDNVLNGIMDKLHMIKADISNMSNLLIPWKEESSENQETPLLL